MSTPTLPEQPEPPRTAPGPIRIIAKTLDDKCPGCRADTCPHEPGPLSRHEALNAVAALEAAGYIIEALEGERS